METRSLALILILTASLYGQTKPAEGLLDFGQEGLDIPPARLVNVTTARTVRLLGEAFREAPTREKRIQYLHELGMCKKAEAVATITQAMRDGDAEIRAQALRSARLSGLTVLADAAMPLLTDAEAAVRREAVLTVATLGQAQRAFSAGIDDKDVSVSQAALRVAQGADAARAIAGKLDRWKGAVLVAALETLGRIGESSTADAVARYVGGDVPVRVAAAAALGTLRPQALSALLGDAHPSVRRVAVQALGDSSSALAALDDGDPTVRTAAAKVLGRAPDIRAVPRLMKLLDDSYRPLHDAARTALCARAPAEFRAAVISAAVQLLENANPRRREDGSFLLGAHRDNAALERHMAMIEEAIKTADWDLVRQAAESLGRIGDVRAGDAVARLLERMEKSGRGDVTVAAVISAAQLGRRDVMPILQRLLNTNPQTTATQPRAAAAWAIGALGDTAAPAAAQLMRRYDMEIEVVEVKFEALKAIGNLKLTRFEPQIARIAAEDQTPELRWIAHWALERIRGSAAAYTPPDQSWSADVSIVDLPR